LARQQRARVVGRGGEDELEDLGYGFRLLFVNGFVNEPGTELSDF